MALVDERDDLQGRAAKDLKRLRSGPFAVSTVVMGEACFLLSEGYQRRRLRFLLRKLDARPIAIDEAWRDEIFDWLERYEEHEPDWADAELAVLCSHKPECRVWTYDDEFHTIWRRIDGSRIPTVPRARAGR